MAVGQAIILFGFAKKGGELLAADAAAADSRKRECLHSSEKKNAAFMSTNNKMTLFMCTHKGHVVIA